MQCNLILDSECEVLMVSDTSAWVIFRRLTDSNLLFEFCLDEREFDLVNWKTMHILIIIPRCALSSLLTCFILILMELLQLPHKKPKLF